MKPTARHEGLIITEVGDEVLVYDSNSHEATCLQPAAALIWRHCDGQTDVEGLAALLEAESSASAREAAVYLALEDLGKAHLVLHDPALPRYNRKELLRKAAVAAAAVAVTTILVPVAASAASCHGKNEGPCGHAGDLPCCAGFSCNTSANKCQ